MISLDFNSDPDYVLDFDIIYDRILELYDTFKSTKPETDLQSIIQMVEEHNQDIKNNQLIKTGHAPVISKKKYDTLRNRKNETISEVYMHLDNMDMAISGAVNGHNLITVSEDKKRLIYKDKNTDKKIEILEESCVLDSGHKLIAFYHRVYSSESHVVGEITEYIIT